MLLHAFFKPSEPLARDLHEELGLEAVCALPALLLDPDQPRRCQDWGDMMS